MSYLHRPGPAPGVAGSGTPLGAGGAAGAGAGGPAAGAAPQQHVAGPPGPGAGPAMAGRLSELLDYVKAEFEAVSSQADTLRRDNHEFVAHAEMHLAEVSAIRRELTELEREHTRAKQAYEEKIADLKRQIETMRAQTGQGPPIPSVIPANTNHFGALMGHPHGMFGQGGPDRERVEMERERATEREGKMVNGSNGPQASAAAGGALNAGPGGPGQAPTLGGPGGAAASSGHAQHGRPGPSGYSQQQQQQPHHRQDSLDRAYERDGPYQQQQLGKRTRPDEPMYDGQPPSAKSRVADAGRPRENGVESRSSAASSFPPVRPPSRTFAQSPHGRPISAASGAPTIANAPPSEPSVLSAGPSTTTNGDQKPSVGSLNPPIQLQRPSPSTQPASAAAAQAPEDRPAKKADGPPAPAPVQTQPRPPKQPDWEVTYNQEVPKKLEVALAHTFLHDSVVCCVRISPNGKLLATGCNRNTTLYDTKTGAVVAQLAEEMEGKPDNYIRAVAFSPDGKRIASGSEDKIIRIWDLTTQKLVSTLRGHDSEIYSLAFSPDGTQLVSGSGDRTARIWSLEQNKVLKELRIDETRKLENGTVLDAGVTSIAISPDGKLLIAGSLDHVVRVWDMQTGALLDKLKNHKDSVYSVAFLPGGKQLLTGSLDKTLKIWDLTALRQALTTGAKIDPEVTHTVCKQTFVGHKDFVLSVAASPDGNYIASGSKDRAVQCWDVRTGKAQFVVHGHKNSVISIAMSEVGGLLATGSGDWQARLFRITGMDEPIQQVATPVVSTQAQASAKPASVQQQQAQTQPPTQPPKAGEPSEAGKEAVPNTKQEIGTTEVNGKPPSKEPSTVPAPGPSTSEEVAQPSPAVRHSTPSTATAPASNAPGSPSAMKVDSPADAAPSKAASQEDTPASAEGVNKAASEKSNTDSKMADSPAPQPDVAAKA